MSSTATQHPQEGAPIQPVIIVGAGLAGLVAAFELTQLNVPVILLDQENASSLGGQAFWSLGGLFCVDSAEQRARGIQDSRELAMRDWLGSARFDREKEDYWPRRWAKAFVDFATDEMEEYVKARGIGFYRNVGWAERGDGRADGHGNSVPRFHLTWGTGPEVVRVFAEPVLEAEKRGLVEFRFRHMVDEVVVDETSGRAVGVRGRVLEQDDSPRGVKTSRTVVGEFELRGSAVLVSSGGIGGDVDKVKKHWPVDRLGPKVPDHFVVGVPAHVDGRMIDIAESAGANVINRDRMWHYTEGLANWDPIWPGHGIRVIPAPSSLWLDATGKRLPAPLFPGCDTLATLQHICSTGYDYSWFIADQQIVAREFALSGSEQNPDLTGKSYVEFLRQRLLSAKGTIPVQNFVAHGADFIVRDNLPDLVAAMNALAASPRPGTETTTTTTTTPPPTIDLPTLHATITARDAQFSPNPFSKDAQAMLVHNARTYTPDRLGRVVAPHPLLNPSSPSPSTATAGTGGPLVAVRMNLLTRKTLGGIETNLDSAVMRADGSVFAGLYAAGEAAGFGGGGVHGYSSLEGTFLGGCIFSGRAAGRAMAWEVAGRRPAVAAVVKKEKGGRGGKGKGVIVSAGVVLVAAVVWAKYFRL